MSKNYTIGKQVESWKGNTAQSLTFIVTADCNLRCKYCYITHKSSNKRMSFEVARKFIDYVLNSPIHKQEAVILDFIGGEQCIRPNLSEWHRLDHTQEAYQPELEHPVLFEGH